MTSGEGVRLGNLSSHQLEKRQDEPLSDLRDHQQDGPQAHLQVAVCEITSVDDLQTNLEIILSKLKILESDPPDLICFPENCLYLRVREGQQIRPIDIGGPEIRRLAEWARTFSCAIHLGSVPMASNVGAQAIAVSESGDWSSSPSLAEIKPVLYNSSILIKSDGGVHDIYQKVHLFDVDVTGHKAVRESDVFTHGAQPAIFEIKGWKIGSTICYDLRFAEIFLQYAKAEVDAVVVPSAFLVPTGLAHWHVLLRARAIESQNYVLAAAQGGVHRSVQKSGPATAERKTFGHSLVVDPWGQVIAEVKGVDLGGAAPGASAELGATSASLSEFERAGILRVSLSRARLDEVRRQIPMRDHRRL